MGKEADWKIIASRYIVQSPYLRLRADNIELPGGALIEDYYVRESSGFAIVFALTPEENVVLVRQYKHGIGQTLLELPAGMLEPGEEPAHCASRELAEETGYVGEPPEPQHAASFITEPTASTSRFHLFLVRNARALLPQNLDVGEQITVELATLPEVRRFIQDGTISAGSSVAAAYYMLDRLGRL
jgi:ADP-ribose pyrophosphatase